MPYRPEEGFSWESTDRSVHTRRIIAALVLLAAGWAGGFFSGRMSAWIFPVTDPDTRAVAAVQSKSPPRPSSPTAQINPQPVSPPPRVEDRQAAAPPSTAPRPEPSATPPPAQTPRSGETSPAVAPATPPATTADTDPAKTPATRNDRQPESAPAATPEEPPAQRIRPAGQGFALVNPEWEQHRPRTPQRDATLADPRDRDDDQGRANRRGREADMIECERRYSSFRRSDGTYQPYDRNSRELCPLLR